MRAGNLDRGARTLRTSREGRVLCLALTLALAACDTAGGVGDDDDTTSLDGGRRDGGQRDGGGASDGRRTVMPLEVDAQAITTNQACRHVDLVFSVDNSSSMEEEKTAMRETVFPAFATALRQIGGGLDDYRVGVLDACAASPWFHTRGASRACNFQSGAVWMDSHSTALIDEFRCVGDLTSAGTLCTGDNDDEQPASASAAALEATGTGERNAGFLRNDALLVVVAITDEDEQPVPSATPQQVYDRLVAIKGDVRRMAFLGIGGAQRCTGVYGTAKAATHLRELTGRFEAQGRGVFWDLCQGQLEQGLTRAMQVIDQACSDFRPPG